MFVILFFVFFLLIVICLICLNVYIQFLPFNCDNNPSIGLFGNNNNKCIIIQNYNCFHFNLINYFIEWRIEKLLWIAFEKNNKNNDCFFDLLPKAVIKYILTFLNHNSTFKNDISFKKYCVIYSLSGYMNAAFTILRSVCLIFSLYYVFIYIIPCYT